MPNDLKQCKADLKQLDFEAEYYRAVETIKKLENENAELKNTLLGMCKSLFCHKGE